MTTATATPRANGKQPHERLFQIPLDSILPSRFQVRKHFAEEQLQEMAATIKKRGDVEQPLLVRPSRGRDRYELVAGERRLRAAKLAGLATVSARVRKLTDEEAAVVGGVENLQRESLLPSEEGQLVKNLMDLGMDLYAISEKVGKSAAYLQKRVGLLDQPEEVQGLVDKGDITLHHVDVIAELPTVKDKKEAATMAAQQRLTAVQLKARTQHKRQNRRSRTDSSGYNHQQLSRDILALHANLESLEIDPELPADRRQTLSKQIGVLTKALEKAQREITAGTPRPNRSRS